MRLRAINTRGCVLQARVSRVEQSTWTGTAAFPSGRVDAILRALLPVGVSSPASFILIRVHYTRDAFTGVSPRESNANGGGPCQALFDSSHFSFFFFCRNESTVGIPLSLSFRWSVRPLILACTPRASQVSGSLLGRKENGRTDRLKEHRSAPVCICDDSRFVQKLACKKMRTDRGLTAVKASTNVAANCAFQ